MLSDQELIDQFIAEHGVTRCPAAIVADSTAELSPEDVEIHRLRGLDPMGDLWRKETKWQRMAQSRKIGAHKRALGWARKGSR